MVMPWICTCSLSVRTAPRGLRPGGAARSATSIPRSAPFMTSGSAEISGSDPSVLPPHGIRHAAPLITQLPASRQGRSRGGVRRGVQMRVRPSSRGGTSVSHAHASGVKVRVHWWFLIQKLILAGSGFNRTIRQAARKGPREGLEEDPCLCVKTSLQSVNIPHLSQSLRTVCRLSPRLATLVQLTQSAVRPEVTRVAPLAKGKTVRKSEDAKTKRVVRLTRPDPPRAPQSLMQQ